MMQIGAHLIDLQDPLVQAALEQICAEAVDLKVLGSYPRAVL